jgi:hypothetical protein
MMADHIVQYSMNGPTCYRYSLLHMYGPTYFIIMHTIWVGPCIMAAIIHDEWANMIILSHHMDWPMYHGCYHEVWVGPYNIIAIM